MSTGPDEFLTVTQVAARLGTTERVIKRYIADGTLHTLHALRIGKAIRLRWSDVESWLVTLQGKDPATMPATRPVTKGIPEGSAGTSEPVAKLVRGPKGRNRERLKQ